MTCPVNATTGHDRAADVMLMRFARVWFVPGKNTHIIICSCVDNQSEF